MSTTTRHKSVALVTVGTLMLAVLVACESPSRREGPATAPPPTATPDAGQTQATPVAPPASIGAQEAAPPSQAEAPAGVVVEQEAAPIVPVEPPEPPLPDFIRVLERFERSALAHVEVNITSRRRLAIETRNVSRLRIERERLPMDISRSIVLRLDGQGIEWTASSTTREFERSVNGAWAPAKQCEP